jgi:hypothetical protein
LFLCITFLDSSGSLAVLFGCIRRPLSAIRNLSFMYSMKNGGGVQGLSGLNHIWSDIFRLTMSSPKCHPPVKGANAEHLDHDSPSA